MQNFEYLHRRWRRAGHPGIAPVYGLGRYADSRTYYVMRFVRGDGPKEAREQAGQVFRKAAVIYWVLGDLKTAEKAYGRSRSARYRRDRAEALTSRAGRHVAERRDDAAETRRILGELAAKEPENRTYPACLGRAEVTLGRLRLEQGRIDEGRKLQEDGASRLEATCQLRPECVRDRASRDEARAALKRMASESGPPGASRTH